MEVNSKFWLHNTCKASLHIQINHLHIRTHEVGGLIPKLKRFLDLYFAGKREEFFKRSCITKHEFLTKMNQDKPKFNKKQQKKILLKLI